MKCRLAHQNDLQVLKMIWYEVFLEHESQKSIDFYFENNFDLNHTFVLENDASEIVCTLQLNQHDLVFNEQQMSVSFVVGVATLKKEQRKGYMRLLLNYAIDYSKDTLQQEMMILQAYNWNVYRSFGFYEAYYKSEVTFTIDDLKSYEETALSGVDSSLLLDIYNKYTRDLNGYKIRDEKYFIKHQKSLVIDNTYIACNDNAYLFYQINGNNIEVVETAYGNKIDLMRLLKTIIINNNAQKAIVSTDIKNFNDNKKLFMMVKNLSNKDIIIDDSWYISEWV